jgi:hypothetical protein
MSTRHIALAMGAALLALSAPAHAENLTVKCHIGVAKRAPMTGDALVANVPGAMRPIPLDAVQFIDKKMAKSVIVEGLFQRRTETGAAEVIARLVNCTKKPLQLRARTSFLDQQQAPAEPTSAWKMLFLPPLSLATYAERSIRRESVDSFLIEVGPN